MSHRMQAAARKLSPLIAIAVGVLTLISACTITVARPGIYVAIAQGGAPGWIGEPDGIPVPSPVDDTVAWGGEDGVFVGAMNGRGAERLTDLPVAGRVGWSPDGTKLAFVDRSSKTLTVIDARSREVAFREPIRSRELDVDPPSLLSMGGPTWSPDGTRLAFVCWDGHGDELCTIGTDGSGRRQLTSIRPASSSAPGTTAQLVPASSNVGPPAWSPDGAAIAVAAYPERSGATSGVFVVNLSRNAARRASTLLPISELAWSPTGDALVFAATRNGRSDVMRVPLAGGAPEVLTARLPEGATDPALSRDGGELAVASNGAVIIVADSKPAADIRNPGLLDRYPSWSADGKAIAYLAEPDPIQTYR